MKLKCWITHKKKSFISSPGIDLKNKWHLSIISFFINLGLTAGCHVVRGLKTEKTLYLECFGLVYTLQAYKGFTQNVFVYCQGNFLPPHHTHSNSITRSQNTWNISLFTLTLSIFQILWLYVTKFEIVKIVIKSTDHDRKWNYVLVCLGFL